MLQATIGTFTMKFGRVHRFLAEISSDCDLDIRFRLRYRIPSTLKPTVFYECLPLVVVNIATWNTADLGVDCIISGNVYKYQM